MSIHGEASRTGKWLSLTPPKTTDIDKMFEKAIPYPPSCNSPV